tara:strand:- start:319 stop:1101 length:783 start_codon:yes stop_codon:yes gene_type:complete
MIFLHPSIDPVIFSLGNIEIRWYGLAYVAAFLLGIQLMKRFNNKIQDNINTKIIDDFFIWSIIGVIVGGRLGYVIFYQTLIFLNDPFYIFYIWQGGMSFHGGLIGIIISTYFFSKIKNISFFYLSDLISLVAPIGIFFGRIANFINVELIGKVTNFPVAVIYPTIDNLPRHPSQLYEAFFEGLILLIILYFFFLKFYNKKRIGKLSGLFLLFYGVFRFLIEFIREPDANLGLFFNLLSMGQLLSLPLLFFGFLLLIKRNA